MTGLKPIPASAAFMLARRNPRFRSEIAEVELFRNRVARNYRPIFEELLTVGLKATLS
jgi:hypothetical protein